MTTPLKNINKYQIKGTLGQGAMGVVYLGYDEQIDRKVAIKTIAPSHTSTAVSQNHGQRFVQEAKLLAKCNHPNIVSILDFGQQDQMAYMVMEYVNGPNLKELLNQTRGFSLKAVLSMFVQTAKALNAAHQHQIIHRDLKPENILLADKKTLKLTDFGIAKDDDSDLMTQIGVTVGTPKYMAPEQMFGSDELGPYTDIYSLFVILFELLSHVSDQHKYELAPIPFAEDLAKHNQFKTDTLVPTLMHNFLSKGLSVSYLDRYSSSAEVLHDLKPILHSLKSQVDLNEQTKPAETDATSGFFTTGTVVTQSDKDWALDDDHFSAIRTHLSDLIGPMADFILTNALKNSRTQDQFIMLIAEKLDSQSVRDSFIDRWRNI